MTSSSPYKVRKKQYNIDDTIILRVKSSSVCDRSCMEKNIRPSLGR